MKRYGTRIQVSAHGTLTTELEEHEMGSLMKYEDVAPLIKAAKTYKSAEQAWTGMKNHGRAEWLHTEYVNARDALFALVEEDY